MSERFACRVLGQHRSTQRKIPTTRDDEAALTADIIALAVQYGRYGYRRITAMLHQAGWTVNRKRVERIWRREGLKVPQKQPKSGRLWLNDGSCLRLKPEHPNHVWSYDFGGSGKNHVSIKRGQKLTQLDYLLRDPKTADIVVCNKKRCYPAFALDQQEFIRLEGCKIVDALSDEDGLERHKIEDIDIEAAPHGDSIRRRGHLHK